MTRIEWSARWTVAGLIAACSLAVTASTGAAAADPSSGQPTSTTQPQPQVAPDAEAQFLGLINNLRASKGVGTLSADGTLISISRRWAYTMAEQGHISHNPSLASEVPGNWIKLGENVGVGPDVDTVFRAFVASAEHYRNLVDPGFSRVGVGVVRVPGGLYTTHDFEQLPVAPAPVVPVPIRPRAAIAPITSPATSPAPVTSVSVVSVPATSRLLLASPATAPAVRLPTRRSAALGGWPADVALALLIVGLALAADRLVFPRWTRGSIPPEERLAFRLLPYRAVSPPSPPHTSKVEWIPDAPATVTIDLTALEGAELARQIAPYDMTFVPACAGASRPGERTGDLGSNPSRG